MFFIFGWNRSKAENIGVVNRHQCQNCHNTEFWQLNKISRYFTIFFIPIFPHSTDYWYHCPICNYGLQLKQSDYENYKEIAEINNLFIEKKINETDRDNRLKLIYNRIDSLNEIQEQKYIEESKNFEDVVKTKTEAELDEILNADASNYNPAFVIAAKFEKEKRTNS